MSEHRRRLFFFAHPDDETLAAGGTIARSVRENHEVFLALPFTGVYSRGNIKKVADLDTEYKQLMQELWCVDDDYGIPQQNVTTGGFPDNQADKGTRLELIQWLEQVICDSEPDEIYTHHRFCSNIDHQYCHEAAVIASRPSERSHISVYAGEIPSSTGYLRPTQFEPNVYVEISIVDLDHKLNNMQMYSGEARKDPHPRSKRVLESVAKVRGSESGFLWAEAFMLVRGYK